MQLHRWGWGLALALFSSVINGSAGHNQWHCKIPVPSAIADNKNVATECEQRNTYVGCNWMQMAMLRMPKAEVNSNAENSDNAHKWCRCSC